MKADIVTTVNAVLCLTDLYSAIANTKEESFVPAVARSKLKSDLEDFVAQCVVP